MPEIVADFLTLQMWRAAVMKDRKLTPSMRLVAVALYGRLNLATGQLNPSADCLAIDTGQSRFGVQKQIEALCAAGWIAKISTTRGRTSNGYALATANLALAVEQPTCELAVDRCAATTTANDDGSNRQLQLVQPPTKPPPTANQLVGTNRKNNRNRAEQRAGKLTRLPDDFPADTDRRAAFEHWRSVGRDGIAERIDQIVGKFRGLHRHSTRLDWPAAWRNWFENERSHQRPLASHRGLQSAFSGIASQLLDNGDNG